MPKRLVDGEALWHSTKLRNVPAQFRAEYANLIPLAEADGTFEADTRMVWSKVYSYNREDITIDDVGSILNAFEEAGMLSRKSDESGRIWGRLNGIELRLPPESHRDRYKQGNSGVFNELDEEVRPDGVSPSRLGIGLDSIRDRLGANATTATSGQDAFKEAKKLFRRYVGVSFGSLGNRANQWEELARKHGSVLIEAVELYSRELGKAGRNLNYPLAHFLKNADEFIEAILDKQAKPVQQTYVINEAVEDPFAIAPDPDALSPEEILANRDKI